MEEHELLREMEAQNRWWAEKTIELDKGLIERGSYRKILQEAEKKEITGIIGLRRIGKTTILKQIISALIEYGVGPKNILFFSFDGFKKEDRALKQVIENYFNHIAEITPDKMESRLYVFFDEVQKVREWGEEIKSFYDKGYNIKFFVSGSSSMNILRGSGESLIGRINLHKIFPFSFREFLRFNGIETEKVNFLKIKYPKNSERILILFNKYIKVGGFPELYSLPEREIKLKLKTYLDLTFYRDIINMFEIKRPDVLEGLFFSLLKVSGGIANYNNLCNSLNTKFETLKTYIEYLLCSFLISQSRFFSKSRKSVEKNAKIYVGDHSFANLSDMKEGMKIETIIYNHCRLLAEAGEFDDIFYWSDKKNEVDIILTRGRAVVPIEVKYREDPKKISGMLKFMEKFSFKKGIIITKDVFEEKKFGKKEILFIPAWLFLLAA